MAFGERSFADSSPKVLLIFVSGVGYTELSPSGQMAKLRHLSDYGSIGLLHVGVAGEPTEAAAFLSIGAGMPLAAPEKTGPKFKEAGIERTVADYATDAFRADTLEGNVVCRTYRKRYGEYPPLRAHLIHIGVPVLQKAQKDKPSADRIGALGEVLHQAKKRVSVLGDWQAVLVGMDKRYTTYGGALRPLLLSELPQRLRETDVLIYNEESPKRLLQFLPMLIKLAGRGSANVLLVCAPRPFADPEVQPVLFALGKGFPKHSLLTSASTNKAGHVEGTDIAPTVALLAHASFPAGNGSPLKTVVPKEKPWDTLDSGLKWGTFVHQWGPYIGAGIAYVVAFIAFVIFLLIRRRKAE